MISRADITDEELKSIKRQRKQKQSLKKQETLKERKFIEFSKKIMFSILSASFAVIIFAMYIIRKTNNTTYLDTLIIEVFKFSKTAVIFYYSKASIENYQKIKQSKKIEQINIQNEINQEEII
ncbi:MAG: hypothetical protein ACTTIX_04155 [Peptoanaerobacter stomatis]